MPKGNWQSPRYLCRCGSEIRSNSWSRSEKNIRHFLFVSPTWRSDSLYTVTGAKRYSADLEQGGLEVPCVLKFVGDGEKLKFLLDKTQKLVCYALSMQRQSTLEATISEPK